VQLGQPLSSTAALNDGTGGTINIGDLANTAYFTQSGSNPKFAPLLIKYHVPLTSKPESDAVSPSSTGGNPPASANH
jgi:hypothetical protein